MARLYAGDPARKRIGKRRKVHRACKRAEWMDVTRAQSIIRGIYEPAKNEEAGVHERARVVCACLCVCACIYACVYVRACVYMRGRSESRVLRNFR